MYDEAKTKFVMEFEAGGTFTAITAARLWLEAHGYSIGSMCGDEPMGIKYGDFLIAKWRNLGPDKSRLDGVITSPDFREGGCQIEFWIDPRIARKDEFKNGGQHDANEEAD